MIDLYSRRGSIGYLLAFGLGMIVARTIKKREHRMVWQWNREEEEGFHHGPWCHGPWCEERHESESSSSFSQSSEENSQTEETNEESEE